MHVSRLVLAFSLSLGLLLACLALPLQPVAAQPPTDRVQFFNYDGKTHVIAWPAGPEHPISREVIIEAVQKSLEVYKRLFGQALPVRAYISVYPGVASHDASLLGAAGRTSRRVPTAPNTLGPVEEVCRVEVFQPRRPFTIEEMKFTLAHEIAHCFQAFFIRAAFPVQDPEPAQIKWWTEGTAEWLAMLVYPPAGASSANHRTMFVDNRGLDLVGGSFSYDAAFFWSFLGAYLGEVPTVNLLRAIPRNPSGYPAFFQAQRITPEVFAEWGRYLGNGFVPHQPPARSLFSIRSVDAADLSTVRLPFDLDKHSFSIVPVLNLASLPPNKGLKLTFSNVAGHGAAVRKDNGEVVTDGGVLAFCNRGDRFFSIGRGSRGRDVGVRVQAEIISCVDQLYDPLPELADASDTCYIGNWRLVSWPSSVPDVQTSFGNSGFILNADGRFTLIFDGIRVTVSGGVTFRFNGVKYDGNYTVVREHGATFKIVQISGNLTGTPNATVQLKNGPERPIDVGNDLFPRTGSSGGVGGTFRLTCRGGNTLEYSVTVGSTTASYHYVKQR